MVFSFLSAKDEGVGGWRSEVLSWSNQISSDEEIDVIGRNSNLNTSERELYQLLGLSFIG